MHRARLTASLLAALALSGCSTVGQMIGWELVKRGSTAAITYQKPQAINTIHHGDASVREVCIQYNRELPLDELVSALQAELKEQGVRSRVYDVGMGLSTCAHWVRYVGSIEWGTPPFEQAPRLYLNTASFALHRADGRLLSTSSYASDSSIGRWGSTRKKIAPVIKALITGFET